MIHTLETLQHYDVPSVFTKGPRPTLSSKYVFVPTQEIVENFLNEGWTISSASQRGNSTFAKHTIRMKLQGTSQVGDTIPEMILTNSHDGKSGFSLMTGLHRLVCSNGLTVPTSILSEIHREAYEFRLG